MSRALDEWLETGEAGEADWAGFVLRLALASELGQAEGVLLDLPALAQPFACRSGECTPGRRDAGARSCCADLAVTATARERAAIEQALPRLVAALAGRDGRWAAGAPALFDGEELRRERGRCIFAVREARGLRCALHQLEVREGLAPGALKPIPCRLFPLVVVDLGEGRRLLTAVHRRTAALVGCPPARRFPCLRGDPARPPLYRAQRDTIAALFGTGFYRALRGAAVRWRRHQAAAEA